MLQVIRKFLPREIEFAKRHPQSLVRRQLLDNATFALCCLHEYHRGALTPDSDADVVSAEDAVSAAVEVLSG